MVPFARNVPGYSYVQPHTGRLVLGVVWMFDRYFPLFCENVRHLVVFFGSHSAGGRACFPTDDAQSLSAVCVGVVDRMCLDLSEDHVYF